MRGSVTYQHLYLNKKRFIPARAGIGGGGDFSGGAWLVHPRSCGDRVTSQAYEYYRRGSSPLVRGSGKVASVQSACKAVHPRSCGDRPTTANATPEHHGSSPLVRGSDNAAALKEQTARFIPARAGIGASTTTRQKRRTVHPRSCGDRQKWSKAPFSLPGSSPLVRGSGQQWTPGRGSPRFIPARAGIGHAV